ncbi:hypothetical protein AYL99_12137 [Fonsecaea erecta]|uniref:Uncharacterized protein n=1 Tax=Fonsecaea erecta TaxID=1367422 RepID=A0A178Z1X9_9EURO|nr:hypothetical protein AYL99_12137 [Fonsecaea erecta]OAP53697.1 hypothetical protein AYL99_12137 [Fonsecaea erecta]
MAGSDLVARGLDISARSIDLLTTLVKPTTKEQSALNLAIEIGRWLGREKLSENRLQNCLEKARGLVQANQQGHKFYEAVISGMHTPKRAAGYLFTQSSGSLGRLMAQDPYLRWMTSTITCLFEFHDENFISDVLCAFIMQSHLGKRIITVHEYKWDALYLQLKPVLDKIVSSIWFNIVNSGVIQPDCAGLAIIESKHLICNLIVWLIFHFKGHLRIVVSGKIIYDQVLGAEDSEIEHRVEIFCPNIGTCESPDKMTFSNVNIFMAKASGLESLYEGRYDTPWTFKQAPRVRQRLYQPAKYPPGTAGRESIRVNVHNAAFQIVNWLLGLRVIRQSSGSTLLFRVVLDQEPAVEKLEIRDLLGRVPSILNMGWRHNKAATVVFTTSFPAGEDEMQHNMASDEEMYLDEDEYSNSQDSQGFYFGSFPVLRDLLESVKKSCRCGACQRSSPSVPKVAALKSGCLRHTAFMETMAYITHSIADAFGADDCSSWTVLGDFGVTRILRDISMGFMEWGAWFDTASRVVLGCPAANVLAFIDKGYAQKTGRESEAIHQAAIGRTAIAIQHGSLAVVAPWIDINQPLSVRKCFSFKIVEGRLGVPSTDGSQFQGLQGDSAIIMTRYTDDVSRFSDIFPMTPLAPGAEIGLEADKSDVWRSTA